MKTVTGKITCSSPISISKATSVLSNFISSDTGASQAINAYLRRASIAFDELARLHSKSDRRKHKQETKEGEEVEMRKEKKKKRKSKEMEEEDEIKDSGSEERLRKKKKRRKDNN